MRLGMIIDTRRCYGCLACVVACKAANATPPGHFRCKVKIGEKGKFPNSTQTFLPTLCNHCEDAPCIRVCPTGASYRDKDGVVRVDADKCIGCQMCMNACPYDARSFYTDPNPSYWKDEGHGPDEYEKLRYKEHKFNMPDKCDFCADRRAQGLPPACVATCAGRARIFGDLDDPNSEIAKMMKKYNPKPLNPELKTKPRVFYITDEKNCPVELLEGHKAKAKEVQPTGLLRK